VLNPESNAPTERQQFWLKHLRACEASGQTTIDYAREHGLNAKSMYSARKGFAHKGPIPPPQQRRFQKVHVATDSNSLESQWQVRLPNGAVVAFGGPLDAATLSLVLNTAANLP
jgi:hypothetical protein